MAQSKLTDAQLQQAIDAANKFETLTEAALFLKLPAETLRHRVRQAKNYGYKRSRAAAYAYDNEKSTTRNERAAAGAGRHRRGRSDEKATAMRP